MCKSHVLAHGSYIPSVIKVFFHSVRYVGCLFVANRRKSLSPTFNTRNNTFNLTPILKSTQTLIISASRNRKYRTCIRDRTNTCIPTIETLIFQMDNTFSRISTVYLIYYITNSIFVPVYIVCNRVI